MDRDVHGDIAINSKTNQQATYKPPKYPLTERIVK